MGRIRNCRAAWAQRWGQVLTFGSLLLALAPEATALSLTYHVEDATGTSAGASTPDAALAVDGADFSLAMTGSTDGDASTLTFSAVNRSLSAQTFTLTATLLLAPPGPEGAIASLTAGLMSQAEGGASGATLASVPGSGPLFEAGLAGSPLAALFPAPFTVACPAPSALPCIAFADDALSGLVVPAASAGQSLELRYAFSLQSGASAAGTSAFTSGATSQVPEPGVGLLFLTGLLGWVARVRAQPIRV
jgi:hypothetical protein